MSSSERKGTSRPNAAQGTAGGRDKQDKRLRPGQLDGLVPRYMKKHKGDLPVSPTTVAHGIKRSSGAVGHCLNRLEQAEKVRLVEKKPRRYDLTDKVETLSRRSPAQVAGSAMSAQALRGRRRNGRRRRVLRLKSRSIVRSARDPSDGNMPI
jgi:hypothetical protein